MIRTQIYLTPQQHKLLQKKAHEESTTISQIIRDAVEKEMKKKIPKQKKMNAGNWLLAMAIEARRLGAKGPTDLASNVDKYLYGEK